MNRITRPIDLQTFRVLATWTLFESEFWPNRFKRLGIRPIQSENFSLGHATPSPPPHPG
jgi:hypothetical protein